MSALRGLMLYAAVLAFAGTYCYFMVVMSTAKNGIKATIDTTQITAAAALSGVLGSAFALKIGVKPNPPLLKNDLATHNKNASEGHASPVAARIRQLLSLEPSDAHAKRWPLTFGIWSYGVVASASQRFTY